MIRTFLLGLQMLLLLGNSQWLWGSRVNITPDRIRLLKEIEQKLNLSFQCEFSVSIGQTRKYATANSSGIIIVDRSFLLTADRDRIFFAVAHEYAHAYLEHDLTMYELLSSSDHSSLSAAKLIEIRRRFEKEADGIAARKAKQMGFSIESMRSFILEGHDAEKGIPPEHRVYSKPRERVDYIQAVYESS